MLSFVCSVGSALRPPSLGVDPLGIGISDGVVVGVSRVTAITVMRETLGMKKEGPLAEGQGRLDEALDERAAGCDGVWNRHAMSEISSNGRGQRAAGSVEWAAGESR